VKKILLIYFILKMTDATSIPEDTFDKSIKYIKKEYKDAKKRADIYKDILIKILDHPEVKAIKSYKDLYKLYYPINNENPMEYSLSMTLSKHSKIKIKKIGNLDSIETSSPIDVSKQEFVIKININDKFYYIFKYKIYNLKLEYVGCIECNRLIIEDEIYTITQKTDELRYIDPTKYKFQNEYNNYVCNLFADKDDYIYKVVYDDIKILVGYIEGENIKIYTTDVASTATAAATPDFK